MTPWRLVDAALKAISAGWAVWFRFVLTVIVLVGLYLAVQTLG